MADTMSYLEGGLNFAFIFEDKKDMFDRYSVALTLESEQVKKAKELGLKVKQDDNKFHGLPYVQLKSNYPPKLFGLDEKKYDGPTSLANGSLGKVRLTQRPYNNKFGQGITTYIDAVKITKAVEYVSADGGFEAGGTTPADLDDDVPF
jgi:hypothetical protein